MAALVIGRPMRLVSVVDACSPLSTGLCGVDVIPESGDSLVLFSDGTFTFSAGFFRGRPRFFFGTSSTQSLVAFGFVVPTPFFSVSSIVGADCEPIIWVLATKSRSSEDV